MSVHYIPVEHHHPHRTKILLKSGEIEHDEP